MRRGAIRRAACALLAAAMTAGPAGAWAAETVPLIAGTQSMQPGAGLGSVQGGELYTSWRGITVSRERMYQARVSGLSICLRVFSAEGETLLFEERLSPAQGGTRLVLRTAAQMQTMTMQADAHALDVLDRVGITEVAVADQAGEVRALYSVGELIAARELLGLADGEQLCVGRDDEPVTIIGVDGVRRQANP